MSPAKGAAILSIDGATPGMVDIGLRYQMQPKGNCMLTTRPIVLGSIVLAFALTGCGLQKGETEVKYEKNNAVNLSEATKTGDYALFTMTDVTPEVVRHVNQGDRLGFRKLDDGSVEAVAGDYTTTLGSKTLRAYWKYYGKSK
jgi:hypothetical protein